MSMLGKVKQDLFDRQAAKDREANEAKVSSFVLFSLLIHAQNFLL